MKRIWLNLVCSFTVVTLCAQPARVFILEAMQRSSWKTVSHVNYTSLQINFNKWQSYDYYHPTGNRNDLRFSYDLRASQYFYTIDSYYGGGYHFSYANIGIDSARYTYDQNGARDGKKISKSGKSQFITSASFIQQFIPYFLLKNLAQQKDSLLVIRQGDEMIIGRNLKEGGSESYHFNAQQELTKFASSQGGQPTERLFKNYKEVGGLSYPSTIDYYVNGVLLTHDSLYNLTTDPIKANLLQLPAGYRLDEVSPTPKVSSLSQRVYLIENVPGERNMLFVDLGDGIFVTEAPLSAEVSQAMIDIIHKTLPGKPIKYVHLSHFHNDHTNGIRALVAEGATIVSDDYTAAVIRTIVDDRSGKFKDKLAAMNVPGNFQTLATFNKGPGRGIIKLYEMPNGHAKGMSFVYLPEEKLIYEGDLFSLPRDGTITPAIEITRQFYRLLKSKNIRPVRIIGHHGSSNITPAILAAAVGKKN